jgi:Tol biopolymer transport system component
MNADGSDQHPLTNDGGSDAGPRWSPDWTKIVYDGGTEDTGYIEVIDAGGSNPQRLTHGGDEYWPSWSPDGSRIVFTADRGFDEAALYTMKADGSDIIRVTPGAAEDTMPVYLPDGSAIGFASDRADNFDLYTVNPAGGPAKRLTYGGCTLVGTPGSDVITGTAGADTICGLGGNDAIRGLGEPSGAAPVRAAPPLVPGPRQ